VTLGSVTLAAAILGAAVVVSCSRAVTTRPAPAGFEPAGVAAAITTLDRILAQPDLVGFGAAGDRLAAETPAEAGWPREQELRAVAAPNAGRARRLPLDLAARPLASFTPRSP